MTSRIALRILLAAVLALCALPATAQQLDFVNYKANHITLNGADWSGLRKSLRSPKTWHGGKWQAVQIGDSHIQPDIMTAQVRQRLQHKWGNGGRGLIAPLNMAHTNEPRDYQLKSNPSPSATSKLVSRSWSTDMGLTGAAARWSTPSAALSIRAKAAADRFTSIVLLHGQGEGYETATTAGEVLFGKEVSAWATRYDLPAATDTATLTVPCTSDFFGAILSNDKQGVMVHAIGNNGATCGTYLKVNHFAEQMQVLDPQLIIISLGTNEAFGSLAGVEGNLHQLVTRLRAAMPKAQLLLTTPMECHKRSSTKVAQQVKVGGGRKRKARTKTVYKTVTSYAANPGVARVRDIIMDYGRHHKIAVWDLYTIAGGAGAAARWIDAGLMNAGDHLHQLEAGYQLQGQLLADALMAALTQKH